MYPIYSHKTPFQFPLGYIGDHNYLSYVKNNTSVLLSQYRIRIQELDTVLSDPSIKGNERRRIRQRRLRALRGQETCLKNLDAVNNALLELNASRLSTTPYPPSAAIAQYVPPILHYPPAFQAMGLAVLSGPPSVAGSWVSESTSLCAEYPWYASDWTYGHCDQGSSNNQTYSSGLPEEGSSCPASVVGESTKESAQEGQDIDSESSEDIEIVTEKIKE